MSIENRNGIWYYVFMVAGQRHRGTCLDASGQPTRNERVALAYEKAQRAKLENVRSTKSV